MHLTSWESLFQHNIMGVYWRGDTLVVVSLPFSCLSLFSSYCSFSLDKRMKSLSFSLSCANITIFVHDEVNSELSLSPILMAGRGPL
jgi:hypothetical protein